MPGQLQNGASAYYAQQQQPPGGGGQQPPGGGGQPIPGIPQHHHHYQYAGPAGQEPNVINGGNYNRYAQTLVVEVGISSSCTLVLQILHRNSRRIYRIRRTGRRRISSKRARITANRRISDIQSTRRLSINRPPRR